ncbi:SOSS complex subunit B2, partial [Goodea atripinnis]
NGAMPPFPNNPTPGAPRDPTFGSVGRPNGRSTGNGAPPVNAAGPPTTTKSSVTISNGRDPRRAKR